jgi:Xaa-Pro aminopeptidase
VDRATDAMVRADVDAMCVSIGSDLPYLTGYRAHVSERPTILVLTADGEATMVIATLEAPRVERRDDVFALAAWDETDDPIGIVDDLLDGASHVAVGSQMWSRFTIDLQGRRPDRRWSDAEDLMAGLRIIKGPDEIDALRAAAATVDRIADEVDHITFSGRTEADVAREIADMTLAAGHQSIEFCIVASGPNGASPHHTAADRVMGQGDAVVVDFGGYQNGYCSDTTRTFVIGAPPRGFTEAYAVLREAQEAATAFVRPGVETAAIDAHARGIIDAAGYGDRFFHRLGHGIGLDGHERPYLVDGDTTVTEPGMAFSIEPGIYTAGEWGMRIEDIVVVTEDGVASLNRSNRGFRVVS